MCSVAGFDSRPGHPTKTETMNAETQPKKFKPHVSDGKGLLTWPPEPGRKFRLYPKGPYHAKKGCPCEIRGVVDDHVVYRWWRRGSGAWRYEMEHWYFFQSYGLVDPESYCSLEEADMFKGPEDDDA